MPTLQYSDSPNVDTAFVVQEGGQKNRAVLTAPQDTSTLELPDNPNSTKGYVTVDGKKHKVILTANIAGGSGGGDVSSVNGKTGAVVLDAEDVSAVPQYEELPTASADNLGEIAQYSGETDESYTNGYFYKSSATYSDPTATISQTAGSGLTDLAVDLDTFVAQEQPTQSESVVFVCTDVDSAASLSPTFINQGGQGWEITIDTTMFLNYLTTNWSYVDYSTITKIVIVAKPDNLTNFDVELYSGETRVLFVGVDTTIFTNGILVGVVGQNQESFDIAYTPATVETWEKNSEVVDLADYGITFTGSPIINDALTVVYTAPAITGYAWNQINVQPDPEIPEPVDIKWATSVDLPVGYSYPWECYPIYTVTGGLPDGTYDFYWRLKCRVSESGFPFGVVTYHAKVTIDNTNHTFRGMFEPVINDAWLPSDDYIPATQWVYDFVKTSGSDMLLYANTPCWKSNVPVYSYDETVQECFKISVIKNIDTGEEYTPTGVLYNGTYPSYDWQYNGNLRMLSFAQTPYIPTYHQNRSEAYTANERYVRFEANDMLKTPGQTAACSEIDFSATTSSGGIYHIVIENTADRYIARVLEATGDLATAQMCYDPQDSNRLYLDFNSAGNSGTINFVSGLKGSSVPAGAYLQNTMNALTPIDIANVGETVTVNNIGLIEQYKGATDANYTNGYFYKSEGTIVTTPETMTPSNYSAGGTPIADVTVSIDITSLIAAFMARTGWTESYIKERLVNNTSWNVNYDFSNSTLLSIWWNGYGEINDDSSILSCFTVTTTGSYSGSMIVDFTGTYTPETKSVTGGTWTRVDVQPLDLTGVTGYDATKTQVLKNVQGTLTWVDE